MVSVTQAFIDKKNAKENDPVFLYQILDYDGVGSNLYYAEHDADITFDGILYSKFPIKHDFVGENTQGEVSEVTLTLSNVSRAMQALLESYEFYDIKVKIIMVWQDDLATTTNKLEHTFYISHYTADSVSVVLTLSSRLDVLDVTLPRRSYSRNHCQWVFKSTHCGYSGGETVCNKTKQRCKELSNYKRFGGFPSIKQGKVILA